jgi:phosphoribosylformylglycinamidine synthase
VLGVVGLLEKATRYASIAFRDPGRAILLLGRTPQPGDSALTAFGSSQYAKTVLGRLWGLPPDIDLQYEGRVQACCRQLIAEELVQSSHDLSDGGLAVALAECCIASGMGASIELSGGDPRLALFAEDPSRILVSVTPQCLARVNKIVSEYNIGAVQIGTTGSAALSITQAGKALFRVPIAALSLAYETSFENAVEGKQTAASQAVWQAHLE